MEIRIVANKKRSAYAIKDSFLGDYKAKPKEHIIPFLELIMKELENEQQKNNHTRSVQ